MPNQIGETREKKLFYQPSPKECGSCQHWMKSSSCPLEKAGKKPSCSHYPCNLYITKKEIYA